MQSIILLLWILNVFVQQGISIDPQNQQFHYFLRFQEENTEVEVNNEELNQNSIFLGFKQKAHSIGTFSNNSFIIVWGGYSIYQATQAQIYAQSYTQNGERITLINVSSNDMFAGQMQENPNIGVFSNDSFIIIWDGLANKFEQQQVFGITFSNMGEQLSFFELTSNSEVFQFRSQIYPSIGILNNNDFVITWEGSDSADRQIWAQTYTSQGELTNTFMVNDLYPLNETDSYRPTVLVLTNDSFIIVWAGNTLETIRQIFARNLQFSGVINAELINVTNEQIFQSQNQYSFCSLGLLSNGSVLFSWFGATTLSSKQQIWIKVINPDGSLLDPVCVSNNSALNQYNQEMPWVQVLANDSFVINWEGSGAQGQAIFSNFFNSNAEQLTGIMKMNSPAINVNSEAFVKSSLIGNDIIMIWQGEATESDITSLFGQRISENIEIENWNGTIFHYIPPPSQGLKLLWAILIALFILGFITFEFVYFCLYKKKKWCWRPKEIDEAFEGIDVRKLLPNDVLALKRVMEDKIQLQKEGGLELRLSECSIEGPTMEVNTENLLAALNQN